MKYYIYYRPTRIFYRELGDGTTSHIENAVPWDEGMVLQEAFPDGEYVLIPDEPEAIKLFLATRDIR